MSDEPHGNGAGDAPRNELVLTLQLHPWHLSISGTVQNESVALAMLRQAMAVYESRERFLLAQDMASQLKHARSEMNLIERLTGKR